MGSSIGRVTEITASSDKSFEHAVDAGVKRAAKTRENITGAWVQDMKVDVADGKITAYRVSLKLTFILKD
jgi:flavin-binding protein dodecin